MSTGDSSTLVIDPEAAKKAYDAVKPRLDDMRKEAIAIFNVDAQDVIIKVLTVHRFVSSPEPKARFALLPTQLFNPAHLADLEPLALALSHTNTEQLAARSQKTEAKLPVELVEEASAVKERMLHLSGYVFSADKAISDEIESIRSGSGYKDLASDLTRLAKVYAEHKSILEKDTFTYRATDVSDARALAQKILHELGEQQSAEERKWTDQKARVWTLLRTAYDEVQDAGYFLYRHDSPEEKFPSLYRSGRPRRSPKLQEGGGGNG